MTAILMLPRNGVGSFREMTSQPITMGNFPRRVACNGAVCVSARGGTPQLQVSQDGGLTWTQPGFTANSVIYDTVLGLFVAVRGFASGQCLTSVDGVAWNTYTISSEATYQDVVRAGSRLVAVSNDRSANRAAWSTDAINWTVTGLTNLHSWRDIGYGNGRVVVFSSSTATNAAYSDDEGSTWTTTTNKPGVIHENIAYGNGAFVASRSSGPVGRLSRSTDGINWSIVETGASTELRDVQWAVNKFWAMSESECFTSPDGLTWTNQGSAMTGRIGWCGPGGFLRSFTVSTLKTGRAGR